MEEAIGVPVVVLLDHRGHPLEAGLHGDVVGSSVPAQAELGLRAATTGSEATLHLGAEHVASAAKTSLVLTLGSSAHAAVEAECA